jgi:hypothetical protein
MSRSIASPEPEEQGQLICTAIKSVPKADLTEEMADTAEI